ncbi:hypothetical protein GCM10010915_02260 [Microbacterium faecale]|uniref:non-specific serine/threonine protein kinase n=1 Tax=Microbacterium faecale TaxID=1804630 RepID=A0A916Y0F7_9MICO|nr:serine/threonine-protein kinase [Microbacterium faecale]GGD25764.1 hypothetical protein GCM10010915_02260 [Microbacterium faecale]
MKRAPSTPPEIPGFTYLQLLGSGGFADVFLYEQKMPRRRVAIKVLLPDRISTSAAQFTTEANVMAMLGAHPAIVAIYEAGVADDGRPYLVMEYCPRPNLQVRYRRAPFSVDEALATGIPIAAAVETAHRANVLHRDIKPANILVSEYNRPALTDFGIASSDVHPDETQGVSVPWSPPESFADPPRGDARSDVYQLGATVYTLLAGRSPFEAPGGENGTEALIERIERAPLPALERTDVPTSLARVLEQAMAKDPAERHPSALAFAVALQEVQQELGHPVAAIDIFDDGADGPHDVVDDTPDGTTRIRPFTEVASRPVEPVRPPAPADPFIAPVTTGDTAGFAPESSHAPAATPPAAGPPEPPTSFAVPVVDDAVEDDTLVRPAPVAGAGDVPVARRDDRGPEVPEYEFNAPVEFARGSVPVADAAPFRGAAATVPAVPTPASAPTVVPRSSRMRPLLVWGLVVLIVVAVALVVIAVMQALAVEEVPTDGPARDVDSVTELSGVAIGEEIRFTWSNPDEERGDAYLWGIYDEERVTALDSRAESPTVTIERQSGEQTCIEVLIERADGSRSSTEVACVDNAG